MQVQQRLFTAFLSCTRHIASDVAGYTDILRLSASELETEAAYKPVVDRWKAFYSTAVTTLRNRFDAVLQSEDLMREPHRNDIKHELERLYALFGGVLHATHRLPSGWHAPHTIHAASTVVHLLQLYKGTGEACAAGLRYIKQFVSCDLFTLSAEEGNSLFDTVAQLYITYAQINETNSSTLKEGSLREQESAEDIILLLQILQSIIKQEDITFFADAPVADNIMQVVGRCVASGLAYVMPLMTSGILTFPEVATEYAGVVDALVSGHAEEVANLNTDVFDMLMQSLEFGLKYPSPPIVADTLEAVCALAQHHATCKRRGMPGLQQHLLANPTLLSRFVPSILGAVLGGASTSKELLTPAADALLALLLADYEGCQASVADIANAPGNTPELTETIGMGFMLLVSANGVELNTTRDNQVIFRSNFEEFVELMRGMTKIL